MKTSVILGLLGAVEARKHLTKVNGKRIRSPRVEGSCEPACIFEDSDKRNYWCFDFTEPHNKIGWEWIQELADTDT